TLLVVDSMVGQDAVNVAKTFDEQLDISGVIMTKLDGDTRGGATLSIKAITGKPIKFCGIGEKMEDLEPFHPDRMASRILGMGDVLTLIEKAQTAISEEDALKMARKMKEASFDLNDYLEQFENVAKMGDINQLVSMFPGAGKLKLGEQKIDEKQMQRNKAIILSMTKEERSNPRILNYSRRKRIAKGCGLDVSDVNKLIKQYETARDLMKRMMKTKKLPF
ncbi:MAG: signal recognition particle protein, partial [Clostridia bacterium]|nr:signal recognition particle protein [Clostridia bacterium]